MGANRKIPKYTIATEHLEPEGLTPEQRLWLNVLKRAVRDYLESLNKKIGEEYTQGQKQAELRCLRRFFFDDTPRVGNLTWIAGQIIEGDPTWFIDSVRRAVRKKERGYWWIK